MNIGFIGAGKVGCALGKYFGKAPQVSIKGYHDCSKEFAQEAARFTNSKSYETLKELIDACDTIFLTVPDGRIQDTWKEVREFNVTGKTICHCSGAMSAAEAFEGIGEAGAFGYSAHPLFAVSDKYNAYRELTGVFFTLESAQNEGDAKSTDMKGSGLADLQDMLMSLGNPTRIIAAEDKTKYHCAAAMASNLVCGLVQQSIDLMKQCGFAEEEAIRALAPILTGNMAHIAKHGPTASLTGPVERNDIVTVQKHLSCLENPQTRQLYSLLSSKLIEMAQQRHPERDYSALNSVLGVEDKFKTI